MYRRCNSWRSQFMAKPIHAVRQFIMHKATPATEMWRVIFYRRTRKAVSLRYHYLTGREFLAPYFSVGRNFAFCILHFAFTLNAPRRLKYSYCFNLNKAALGKCLYCNTASCGGVGDILRIFMVGEGIMRLCTSLGRHSHKWFAFCLYGFSIFSCRLWLILGRGGPSMSQPGCE